MTKSTSHARRDPVEEFFAEFNAIDWRTYRTFSALSAFECFWRNTEALVSADADRHQNEHGPKWHAETEEEIAELFAEIRTVRTAHDEVMTPAFRYAAVITLVAVFERELRRLLDTLAAERKVTVSYRNLRTSLLEHARVFLREQAGPDLASLPELTQIHNLQKVRDCLVHCYGDAALSRDRAHLLKLSTPKVGLEVEPGLEMVIHPIFVERSLAALRGFFASLFVALHWTINDRWQAKLKPGTRRKARK
ncbi:MAG: hypothetical protein KBC32_01335 [Candidatus Didemnitutus sp.]|nr:hypothetical protein [Candidatus Didemnitutus sp.]